MVGTALRGFAGHADVADFLIEQGADINALSTNGSSVLMMAVYEGHKELARKLIEKGADRTPKNDWGDGALEWAMRQDRLEIARMVSNPEEFNIAVSQPKESWVSRCARCAAPGNWRIC
jgi:ankyrin repeat protein